MHVKTLTDRRRIFDLLSPRRLFNAEIDCIFFFFFFITGIQRSRYPRDFPLPIDPRSIKKKKLNLSNSRSLKTSISMFSQSPIERCVLFRECDVITSFSFTFIYFLCCICYCIVLFYFIDANSFLSSACIPPLNK